MNSAAAEASASNLPPPPAAASRLAPGFRFHPTDEELVSYYLKRKVCGRPLRVDAIAEVELYMFEPWELPDLSRIRNRDQEWYFFTSLDRKYSTRSRTNRATPQGYWKTTGKDRSVGRGPRAVGMKKTLVYHSGRAPRGNRTNWVMHEYRLEDEELTKSGIFQDAHVVCRIFLKNGSGPQNGAQYGAPFLEKEWEVEEDGAVSMLDGGDYHATEVVSMLDGGDYHATERGYFEFSDLVQNEDLNKEQTNVFNFAPYIGGTDNGGHPEDASNLLDEASKDISFTNLGDTPSQKSVPASIDEMEKHPPVEDCSHTQTCVNAKEEYVELKDIADTVNVAYSFVEESVGYPIRNCHVENTNGVGENIHQVQMFEVEEFFDSISESDDQPESDRNSLLEDNIFTQSNGSNSSAGTFTSNQGKIAVCDVPNENVAFWQENVVMNEYLPTVEPSGFEKVDELLVYFDATDGDLHYGNIGFSRSSPPAAFDFAQEDCGCTIKSTAQVPNTFISGASSSGSCVPCDQSEDKCKDVGDKPDDTMKDSNKENAAKKHLLNMLGAISAPAAFAEFPPMSGKVAAAHSANPIHVTSGFIRIYSSTISENVVHGPSQKNGHAHCMLSYSLPDESTRKRQVNPVSMVIRGGMYLFLVSWLILTIIYKVVTGYMARKKVLQIK
ncbi:NAC domain-containing protein 78-like [Zingiber officinale]|uniref:NAC domain-containing protein 78-like n=1 Tax=Zingiber officinale TaxID=94328 RepID=UPI001C4CBA4C|nr:NAC domain-containing protein 78-like [Zingiber officinale]